jgi:hypothetical protein
MGLQAALMDQICQAVEVKPPAPVRSDFEYQLFSAALSSIDFAKAKKCNPSKSHHCVGKTGRGSCVSLTKKCKVPASREVKQVMKVVTGQQKVFEVIDGGGSDSGRSPLAKDILKLLGAKEATDAAMKKLKKQVKQRP